MSESISETKKTILKWYSIWIILQVGLIIVAPDFPWYFRFFPGILIVLSLILSVIGILVSRNKFQKRTIIIKGKVIDACILCPYRQAKDNPFSTTSPIIHCGAEPGLPLVINPNGIPRWCNYAGK